VRANAVEALGDIDSPEIPEILKVLVSDRNNRVRANALKALWQKGIRFGLNTLPEELRSPNSRKRASVAYILGEIKEERSLDLLIGLLSDISPTVRNRAVLSIGKIGSSRVISHLVEAYIKEDENSIRDIIIKTSMEINPELTVARLTEKFTMEENTRLRANMIKSLGAAKNSKSVVLLSKALRDPDGRVRANAVDAMGDLKDSQFSELLFPLLHDSHNRVRSNAAAALWKLGGLGAILTLKQMLRSTHKTMRASAAWALGEIGALQFSDVLQDLTNDGDPDVRRCALKALAKVSKIT
jgi:HEAT repeat protein